MATVAPTRRALALRLPRVARAETVLVAAIVAGAALLRLWRLGGQSFWTDEVDTALLAAKSPGAAWSHLLAVEDTPPVYFAAAWAWGHVAGIHEWALRSLSALAGVATVPVAWRLVRLLAGPVAGVLAALLVATNPMLVWFSQEARSYALLVLLSALALLYCVRALVGSGRRDIWLWALFAALAAATHYYGAFAFAGQAAVLLIGRPQSRRVVGRAIVAVAAVGGLLAVLVAAQYHPQPDGRPANWIHLIPLSSRLGELLRELVFANTSLISSNSAPPEASLRWVVPVVLALGAYGLVRAPLAARAAAPLGAVAAAVVALPLLIALTPVDTFKDRNLIAAWVPLLGAVAIGLAAVRPRAAGLSAAAALALVGVQVQRAVLVDPSLQRKDWRALSAALGPTPSPRAVVVVPGVAAQDLRFYGSGLRPVRRVGPVRELVLAGELGPTQLGAVPPAGFRRVAARQVLGLWLVVLRSRTARTLDTASVHVSGGGLYRQGPRAGEAARR